MEEKFREFFRDKNYIQIKNSLFNYKNRKEQIKKEFYKFVTRKDTKRIGFKILDIGSGISPLSPIPKNTVYIDISPESSKLMKSWGYNAHIGDINKLKERSNYFDFILCSEVLEHIKDYRGAIKELHRVLKPEGKMIVTVPVHKQYWDIDDEFVEHYRRFNPADLSEEFKKVGFKVLAEKPIGSWIERKITIAIVKQFKKSNNQKISRLKSKIIIFANSILYFLVRLSLIFTSKNSTSIMLYVLEKD